MSGEKGRISELGEPCWTGMAVTSKHSSVWGVGTSRSGDGGWEVVELKPALRMMRIHIFRFLDLRLDLAFTSLVVVSYAVLNVLLSSV